MRQTLLRSLPLPSAFPEERTNAGRRKFLIGSTTLAAAIVFRPEVARAAAEVIVTSAPFNANPNSTQDSSPAFQAALNYLSSAGGGVLHVPPGVYYFHSPLSYSGRSLTIVGGGQAVSVHVILHTQTGLTVNLADSTCCLTVRDIGVTPMPGALNWSGGAIACIVPGAQGNWQNFLAENVDFGVAFGNFGEQYSSFYKAILLQNTARARVSNCNAHGNQRTGGIFIDLQGGCNGTRIEGCNIDGYAFGFVVSAFSTGLHLTNTMFIGGTAIQTGTQPYSGTSNLSGLYITGCELNCENVVLFLYQVSHAWISDTDIYGPRVGINSVACEMLGCTRVSMHNTSFGGFFGGGSNQIAIFATSSANAPTGACQIDSCQFENITTAVILDKGTYNVFGTKLAMYQAGDGTLVNTAINWGAINQQIFIDNSGNTTNDMNWLTTSANTPAASTSRMAFER